MKRTVIRVLVGLLLVFFAGVPSTASAETRFIARAAQTQLDGLAAVKLACQLVGCQVRYQLDEDLKRVFLVTTLTSVDPQYFVSLLRSLTWLIGDAEVDQVVRTEGGAGGDVPPALLDREPVDFFGTKVRRGYVRQPASEILGIDAAHAQYKLTGAGITVAVIDTGVDPNHPALRDVLLPGYDFTRHHDGGSEMGDVKQSTAADLDNGGDPVWVNRSTAADVDQSTAADVDQSTAADLDQSTAADLDDGHHDAFGHGTMVSGVIHRVAPKARILPLKAFQANGGGYASDILRAIYRALKQGAKVMNMSFSLSTSSREVQRAIDYATSRGVISVASAGNDGQRIKVYPAALPNVIGVTSTTNGDALSAFANFGPDVAWVAAPGEGIITTYPFGGWAAVWGTSFSAPFASGTAALLAEVKLRINQTQAADAEGHAVVITPEVRRGRLNIPAAIAAWRSALGLR